MSVIERTVSSVTAWVRSINPRTIATGSIPSAYCARARSIAPPHKTTRTPTGG